MDFIRHTSHKATVYNVFIRPYPEALNNFHAAIFLGRDPFLQPHESLRGRADHLIAGICLMIPVINSLAMFIFTVKAKQEFNLRITEKAKKFENELMEIKNTQTKIGWALNEIQKLQQQVQQYQEEGSACQTALNKKDGHQDSKEVICQIELCKKKKDHCEQESQTIKETSKSIEAELNQCEWEAKQPIDKLKMLIEINKKYQKDFRYNPLLFNL